MTGGHLAEIWRYRELLWTLVRRDLKVRYQSSALGFVWSLLNPLVYLVVYYLVFEVFLKNGIDRFPVFLLSGLLPWLMFSGALMAGTPSITANGSLVKKVWFPRAVLPLAAVGTAMVNFFLQLSVLVASLVIFQWVPDPAYLVPALIGLAAMIVLAAALALVLSVANVRARDTMHLVEVAMLVWFWLTPIVYQFERPYQALVDRGLGWLMLLNPLTVTTITMQRLFYGRADVPSATGNGMKLIPDKSVLWYMGIALFALAVGVAAFALALRFFARREGDLAEDI